jgi:hypothetical protein
MRVVFEADGRSSRDPSRAETSSSLISSSTAGSQSHAGEQGPHRLAYGTAPRASRRRGPTGAARRDGAAIDHRCPQFCKSLPPPECRITSPPLQGRRSACVRWRLILFAESLDVRFDPYRSSTKSESYEVAAWRGSFFGHRLSNAPADVAKGLCRSAELTRGVLTAIAHSLWRPVLGPLRDQRCCEEGRRRNLSMLSR